MMVYLSYEKIKTLQAQLNIKNNHNYTSSKNSGCLPLPLHMTSRQRNKIRAFFLLVVFSLNTIMGFACSLGVDMGYNSKHHAHENHSPANSHSHTSSHKHVHAKPFISGITLKASNDDCCTGGATRFALVDKSLSNPVQLQAPAFFIEIRDLFLPYLNDEAGNTVNTRFQFVRRSCFLNDIDIHTAIRRFQI
ncbi:MAG: hypothetical protein INR73_05890 [Williamsia sp.]|nr:hypothetical protein [Williamsia sp.]